MKSRIRIVDCGGRHPNTYRITLNNRTDSHQIIALSTDGGMLEITKIDGARISVVRFNLVWCPRNFV